MFDLKESALGSPNGSNDTSSIGLLHLAEPSRSLSSSAEPSGCCSGLGGGFAIKKSVAGLEAMVPAAQEIKQEPQAPPRGDPIFGAALADAEISEFALAPWKRASQKAKGAPGRRYLDAELRATVDCVDEAINMPPR